MNREDKFDESEIIFDPDGILVPRGVDYVAAGTAKDCLEIRQIIMKKTGTVLLSCAWHNTAPHVIVLVQANPLYKLRESLYTLH